MGLTGVARNPKPQGLKVLSPEQMLRIAKTCHKRLGNRAPPTQTDRRNHVTILHKDFQRRIAERPNRSGPKFCRRTKTGVPNLFDLLERDLHALTWPPRPRALRRNIGQQGDVRPILPRPVSTDVPAIPRLTESKIPKPDTGERECGNIETARDRHIVIGFRSMSRAGQSGEILKIFAIRQSGLCTGTPKRSLRRDGAVFFPIFIHNGTDWLSLIVATCISASMSVICGRVRIFSRYTR